MKGFKWPWKLITRDEYTELKSLRVFFNDTMQMRADQKDFEICPDEICQDNKKFSEKKVDTSIKNLLTHKQNKNVPTIR